jgi:hypothetical protein
MFRALNAIAGGFLFFFGAVLVMFGVDGWVPLGIGAGLLAVDLFIEHRQHETAHDRPRFESDVDHMGGV